MQLYAINHNVDPTLAFYTLTILNAGSIIGRIVPNFIGDIWGPFNTIIVCALSCAVLIICLLAAKTAAGIIVIAVLYGLFSGACALPLSFLFWFLTLPGRHFVDQPPLCQSFAKRFGDWDPPWICVHRRCLRWARGYTYYGCVTHQRAQVE